MSLLRTPPAESALTEPLDTPRADSAPRTDERVRHYATRRWVFLTATAILYAGFIFLGVLTLNPYFAQTWDVTTFIHAAQRLLDGGLLGGFDLYAQSRVAQTWPYAYPPLHALVTALALLIGKFLPMLPEYLWARLPALAADLGVGLALYAIVARKTNDESLARLAVLLWLFNPITFYDTAVQGHFESEWLLFILLAFAWFDKSRSIVAPTLALAVAVLFKQVAILFAIPVWAYMLMGPGKQKSRIIVSAAIFALVVGIVSLPFLLYSEDFLYMNLTYVENVPVQTQSWIVALLGITRSAPDALTSDFFLLRYQTIATMLVAAVIAFLGARRGWSLYLTAALIALAFFLTSKKVMGYYYVMLFPFLLVDCLPKRRFDLILIAFVATTWISLSPYYAAWSNPAHWWIYALLGLLYSLLFVWLFMQLVNGPRTSADKRGFFFSSALIRVSPRPKTVLLVTLGLFAGAVSAAVVQPLIASSASPIRAPLIAPGMEWSAAVAFGTMIGLVAVALLLLARWTGEFAGTRGIGAWGIVVVFAPLFFAVYTLTKEST
ncbi:MAG: hypothetical protein HY782_12955, partial [Chloroflexi bacterium]|nr:hypothetical protein [Chloroflexota bacterium]